MQGCREVSFNNAWDIPDQNLSHSESILERIVGLNIGAPPIRVGSEQWVVGRNGKPAGSG